MLAQRGRKPKPTAIKILEGNPGKRQLNKYEPSPDKLAPECPDWLSEEAKAEWFRLHGGNGYFNGSGYGRFCGLLPSLRSLEGGRGIHIKTWCYR